MFTGIVEEMGTIVRVEKGAKSSRLTVSGDKIFSDLKLGDSVATNGVCLTVTSFSKGIFTADVMNETLKRSNLGELRQGSMVNLERAMIANGRFGGHIVSGHIDGTGVITKIEQDDIAVWYTIRADRKIMKYIIEKGSVAIDGISLTIAKVTDNDFSVSLIPHTAKETVLGYKKTGDTVNLENDVVGKYIEHFLSFKEEPETKSSGITKEFLLKAGF
ncbi:riboflavin synthase [Anaerotignum sp. MSJ-24]|uniref:riboflavin synthase n=1 Tax=Anaerotignum sp. MSJ-24 TaxID=2841521 RepID=UPI001C10C7C1|nr:riboflavin synthase [Anaerotignum sp. MSJ-24]